MARCCPHTRAVSIPPLPSVTAARHVEPAAPRRLLADTPATRTAPAWRQACTTSIAQAGPVYRLCGLDGNKNGKRFGYMPNCWRHEGREQGSARVRHAPPSSRSVVLLLFLCHFPPFPRPKAARSPPAPPATPGRAYI